MEDEIAQRIQNGLAVVDLDAALLVRTVTEDDISTGVDARPSEGDGIVRRLVQGGAALVIVHRHDHPVRHAPRVANPAQIQRDIRFVRDAGFVICRTAHERLTEKRDLRCSVAKPRTETQSLSDFAQRVELRGRHRVHDRVAYRIRAGPALIGPRGSPAR